MKKYVSFLLVCVMLFSFSGLALAAPSDVAPISGTKAGVFQAYKVLTRQEVIQRIMEVEGVSSTVAELRLGSRESVSVATGTIFVEAILPHNFGCGYTAEVGAVCEIDDIIGPGPTIRRILTSWTLATGSGFYTWTEAYKLAEIAPTNYTLTLGARGSIEVAVDLELAGSAELKTQLISAGFTLSASIGSTYYYRKVESWSGTTIF